MPLISALGALLGLAILALFPDPALLPAAARLSEKSALLFLVVTFAIALIPRFQTQLLARREAATWLLIGAGFVLFHLAERAGPREGFSLRFASLPDDAFPVSYALRIVILGAILSFPIWFRGAGAAPKAIWAALGLIGALALGSFGFLAQFFTVGATETLDPTPLPTLFLQILGYGSVAALCRAVASSEKFLPLVLRVLPLVMLLIWAKLQFVALPVEVDAE